jgi:hypothetical protein
VKNVPGRKSDVNDATWLGELLAHGLIRASFVPDTQTQEMPLKVGPAGGELRRNYARTVPQTPPAMHKPMQ